MPDEAILFRQCLGLTDSTAIASQIADPKTGKTQLTSCRNMTITDDGCIQTAPPTVPMYSHARPITRLSAGDRLFFSDDYDTLELDGSTAHNTFPLLSGPLMHTPIDVRLSTDTAVYKSAGRLQAALLATVGVNPNELDDAPHEAQPPFSGGFVFGSRAYGWQGKFLQYSAPIGYAYDLWDLGEGFIPHQFDILQAGSIPGCILCAHAEGVTVYIGGDPFDPNMVKRFYQCAYIDGTLYSGMISKAMGHGHVFMCADGVYMVGSDGAISRLTGDALEYAADLNSSYSGATVHQGKYLAFGDRSCVEYDFRTKAVMLRDSGVSACCRYGGQLILAKGSDLVNLNSSAMATLPCSFTLPYSSIGAAGKKSFDSLYVTGEINGDMEITLLDQGDPEDPERWTVELSDCGIVQNYRVKLPKGTVGSKTAFRFSTDSGSIRIEEIRATFGASQRR